MADNKEYLYIGHYIDTDGNYILKVGTTNDLDRRQAEHTRNYHRAKKWKMPVADKFIYDWYIPLSKYNTLRYEDRTRTQWILDAIGEYIRNDRFCCPVKPDFVEVTIRKTYRIAL